MASYRSYKYWAPALSLSLCSFVLAIYFILRVNKEGDILVLFLLAMGLFWSLKLCRNREVNSKDIGLLYGLVSLSYIFKIIVVLYLDYVVGFDFSHPVLDGPDTAEFHHFGIRVARNGLHVVSELSSGNPGIWLLYGIVYNFFGVNNLIIQAILIISGTLIIPLSYKVGYYVTGSREVSKRVAILCALYPTFATFSFVPHKDVLVTFLLVYSFLLLFRYENGRSYIDLLCLLFTFVVMFLFRFHLGVIFVVSVLLYYLFRRGGSLSTLKRVSALAVFLSVVYFAISNISPAETAALENPVEVTEKIIDLNQAKGSGEGFGDAIRDSTWPVRWVAGSTTLLIRPFPPWRLLRDSTLTSPDLFGFGGLFLLVIMPFFLRGLVVSIKRRSLDTLPLFATLFLVLSGTALVFGGSSYRYRIMVIPIIMLYTSIGFVHRNRYRWIIPITYGLISTLMTYVMFANQTFYI